MNETKQSENPRRKIYISGGAGRKRDDKNVMGGFLAMNEQQQPGPDPDQIWDLAPKSNPSSVNTVV